MATVDEVDAGPVAAAVPATPDILWAQIQETELEDIEEFGNLFSRQTIQKKSKEKKETAPKVAKVVKAKVLDSKRSQNTGIIIKSMHVDFSEVENAIYNCDTSVVSLEVLQQILEIRATPEELSAIEAMASQEGVVMDDPEMFLLKLSRVSHFVERISCLVFQAEFEEAATLIGRKLTLFSDVCNFLVTEESIRKLFSIILTLGNYMNGGNMQRGQADGFGLDILPKLKDVKSNDSKVTLLHYIVHTYVRQCRQTGVALLDLVYPLPSKYDIEKCNNIDFEDLQLQLKVLRDRLASSEARIKEIEGEVAAGPQDGADAAVPVDQQQPQPQLEGAATASPSEGRGFQLKMHNFAKDADLQLAKLDRDLDDCRVLFHRMVQFYKFSGRNNEKVERPSQFFEFWTQFSADMEDIWKRHLNELKQEL